MSACRDPLRSRLSATRCANGGARAWRSCKVRHAHVPMRRRRRRSFGRPQRSRCRCATWRRGSTRRIRDMPPSSVRVRSIWMPFGHCSTRTRCCWSTRWARRAATCGSCRSARFARLRWHHARRSKRSRAGCTRTSRGHPHRRRILRHRSGADEDRRALTRMVIEPAASLLTGKRLVVVLPGALSLIPFGALPQPFDVRLARAGPSTLLRAGLARRRSRRRCSCGTKSCRFRRLPSSGQCVA